MNQTTEQQREAILARDREERKPLPPVEHRTFKVGKHDWHVTFTYADGTQRTWNGRAWS